METTTKIPTALQSPQKYMMVVCRKWCQLIEYQVHFKSKQMASIQIAYGETFVGTMTGMKFCEWGLTKENDGTNFSTKILLIDEELVNNKVNRQNLR